MRFSQCHAPRRGLFFPDSDMGRRAECTVPPPNWGLDMLATATYSEHSRSSRKTRRQLYGRLNVRRTDCGGEAVFDLRRREFITLLGGAAAWPISAGAQQPQLPVIGSMHAASQAGTEDFMTAFRHGLKETGYV